MDRAFKRIEVIQANLLFAAKAKQQPACGFFKTDFAQLVAVFNPDFTRSREDVGPILRMPFPPSAR